MIMMMVLQRPIPATPFLLSLCLLLSACSLLNSEPEETPVARGPEAITVAPLETAVPDTTPLPTTIPATSVPASPTPIAAAVQVSGQMIADDNILLIDSATLPAAGWLAVFSLPETGDGHLLGSLFLEEGTHEEVAVEIDAGQATERLLVRLYVDRGQVGELEIPQPDEPFSTESSSAVDIEFEAPSPSIVVADQIVGEDGVVSVAEITMVMPGWVLVHADENGPGGPVLGYRYLESGVYEDVPIAIRWREGTPLLHAVIHEDDGRENVLEFPDGDRPVMVEGEPVVGSFEAGYPPDILVYDQPSIDGRIIVERVISQGPGWVAIHFDEGGQPGLIIGSAALKDGLNEQIIVELIREAITPILYARLYEDTNAGNDFDFPTEDPPVMYDGRLPLAVPFRSNLNSHLIVRDQASGTDGTVVVEVVVPATDAWLVIYSDRDGRPGAILGQTSVPAGLSRQVEVEVGDIDSPVTLYAMLHQDVGELQEFEYPRGDDTPFYVLGSLVMAPFQVTDPAAEVQP